MHHSLGLIVVTPVVDVTGHMSSGATPAEIYVASMTAEPFKSSVPLSQAIGGACK